MSLYAIKPWFVAQLRVVEDRLVARNVSADSLTYAAVIVSIGAGTALALGVRLLWLAVAPLCLVRLALNALDGSVARRTGTARPFGAVLNEIADRASDAALVGALGFVASPVLALAAVAAAFLCSITGVLALALTNERASSGPMGKADRTALVAAAATAAGISGSTVFFVAALWVITAGSLVTAALRTRTLHREVSDHVPA